jgi:Skp family chaperone for outer membrane proteins
MFRRSVFGLFAALAVLAALWPLAHAQQSSAPVVAVLDIQAIMRDSVAAIGIREQMEAHHARFQAEITERENQLRTADQELTQQRAILSAEVIADRERFLQENAVLLAQLVEKRKRQVTEAFGTAMQQVQKTLMAVVTEIMQERGLNLVLPRAQVVVVAPELEMTADALTRLNSRLTSLAVVIPEG